MHHSFLPHNYRHRLNKGKKERTINNEKKIATYEYILLTTTSHKVKIERRRRKKTDEKEKSKVSSVRFGKNIKHSITSTRLLFLYFVS